MKSILALDLGTKTGWAHKRTFTNDPPKGPAGVILSVGMIPQIQITSGTIDFKNDRYQGGGMRFLKFRKWLDEMYSLAPFDEVYFEEVRARQPSVAADHIYGGLMATLTGWCEERNLPYEGIPVGTIKKFITGKGNANKKEVIEAVVKKGYHPQDDNEADALALLLFKLDGKG